MHAQELEESRASWNVVKAKTAESEEQWVKLKADFAERKRFELQLCTKWQITKFTKRHPMTNNSKNKTSVCATVLITSLSRLLASSSESGISDMDASTSAEKSSNEGESSAGTKEVAESLLATHVEDEFEELSEEIPDPFSDDEGEIVELPNDPFLQQPIGMVTSITSMVNPDIEDEEEEEGEEKDEEGLTPIFVPSLSYLAQVCFCHIL